MIEARGVWGDETTSHPVTESDIRKWAIATYWPDKPPPVYWDEEYARGTKWGGIIAPRDFNPFAWPVDRPPGPPSAGARPGQTPKKGENVLNGGQADTWFAPIRPGDVMDHAHPARALGGAHGPPRPHALHLHRDRVAQPGRRAGAAPHLDRHPLLAEDRRNQTVANNVYYEDVEIGQEIPAFERKTDFMNWNRYAAVNDEFVFVHMDDDVGKAAGQGRRLRDGQPALGLRD